MLHRLSILKVNDVHSAKMISFMKECRASRVPDILLSTFEHGNDNRTQFKKQKQPGYPNGQEPTWVLDIVKSNEHVYGIIICKR